MFENTPAPVMQPPSYIVQEKPTADAFHFLEPQYLSNGFGSGVQCFAIIASAIGAFFAMGEFKRYDTILYVKMSFLILACIFQILLSLATFAPVFYKRERPDSMMHCVAAFVPFCFATTLSIWIGEQAKCFEMVMILGPVLFACFFQPYYALITNPNSVLRPYIKQ